MSLQISTHKVKDETDLHIVSSNCPSCKTENALIIMESKKRYRINDSTVSLMKIECFKCKWKVIKDLKWNQG